MNLIRVHSNYLRLTARGSTFLWTRAKKENMMGAFEVHWSPTSKRGNARLVRCVNRNRRNETRVIVTHTAQ
jgi:hypothetical protein